MRTLERPMASTKVPASIRSWYAMPAARLTVSSTMTSFRKLPRMRTGLSSSPNVTGTMISGPEAGLKTMLPLSLATSALKWSRKSSSGVSS